MRIERIAITTIFLAFISIDLAGNYTNRTDSILKFTVKTYDNLFLPAQVSNPQNHEKKMILFIKGSTPYDEKGNEGAFWNDKGKIISSKNDFYYRFHEIMSAKGYPIATISKRSFVYPTKIPRPNFTDLALDIKYFIEELKKSGLIINEKDLVIVGYSEGSTVTAKVLAMLKDQPSRVILLGSAYLFCDCTSQSIDDFYLTDVLRRVKKWSDSQIKTEFEQLCQIRKDLRKMDEYKFENEYKNSKPFGFGYAMWESFYIDKEVAVYDPVSDLVSANTPVLFCIGEDDMAMPLYLSRKVSERLIKLGLSVTYKTIEKEVHQYKKYDVFAIIDSWITTEGGSIDFKLQKADSLIIGKYARQSELKSELNSIPYEGGNPDKILNCFQKAIAINEPDPNIWFNLGIKLFANGLNKQAYYSFSNATDTTFSLCYGSLVWMGHLKDLDNKRGEAVDLYKRALALYPGFPVQHNNWNIIIDTKWIEDRIKYPFKGVK